MTVMYSFRDRVSGEYTFPFPGSDNSAMVKRAIAQALRSPAQLPWQVFPEDHELYTVGSFDPDTGKISSSGDPQFLMNLSDLVHKE